MTSSEEHRNEVEWKTNMRTKKRVQWKYKEASDIDVWRYKSEMRTEKLNDERCDVSVWNCECESWDFKISVEWSYLFIY